MKVAKLLWLEKTPLLEAARHELDFFLSEQAEIQTFKLIEVLKLAQETWVFKAKINGQRAIIKRFLGGNFAHTVTKLKRELDFLETVLNEPKYKVNRCLYAWPESGIVVLSFAPGKRLGDKIARTSGAERRRLMLQSGEWLRKYCAPRQRERRFGPGYWVKQANAKKCDHISSSKDQLLLETLLISLREQRDLVNGVPVVQAATHGDYAGINAHYHHGTICGVDIQGECWLAVAKDAARFLVWLQIHDSERPNDHRYGISIEYIDAFLKSNVLRTSEHTTTLPFFVGEQLYGRFVEEYSRQEIRENTRSAIEAYLESKTQG